MPDELLAHAIGKVAEDTESIACDPSALDDALQLAALGVGLVISDDLGRAYFVNAFCRASDLPPPSDGAPFALHRRDSEAGVDGLSIEFARMPRAIATAEARLRLELLAHLITDIITVCARGESEAVAADRFRRLQARKNEWIEAVGRRH